MMVRRWVASLAVLLVCTGPLQAQETASAETCSPSKGRIQYGTCRDVKAQHMDLWHPKGLAAERVRQKATLVGKQAEALTAQAVSGPAAADTKPANRKPVHKKIRRPHSTVDTSGTWTCARRDGSGRMTGIYWIRDLEELDPSTCTRVK